MKRTWFYILLLVIALGLFWYTGNEAVPETSGPPITPTAPVENPVAVTPPSDDVEEDVEEILRDGHYSSAEDVARYLFTYGELPGNFITKDEASDLGWVPSEGNLWEVTDQFSIGGDRFYNREKLLPDEKGRKWYECDIDYQGGRRGAKRLVFSNDGLIYYTDDHYESFDEIREGDL